MRITRGDDLFAICRERGWDWREVLDFSESINPLGPPPGVRSAIEQAIDRIAHYPGRSPQALEEQLAGLWHVDAGQVMAGSGATELLHFVSRAGWSGPTALVTPAWPEFHRAFPHALNVALDEPDKWPQRGLLVLSQPVNPTGEAIPEEILRRTIAGREGPVLIEESFIEFTRLESAVWWCDKHPNLLVLRSLSKFYGLPGMRVGALVGSGDWMARLKRRREPWQVSTLAEAAALAAIADRGHAARTVELVENERRWLLDELSALNGLRFAEGVANFLFALTDRPASEIRAWFLDRKILLRDCTRLPGISGEAIRFAVRTRPENERFVAAAKELFCEG